MQNKNDESSIFGVSMRAWMALILILTVCWMSFTGREVSEPLYSMSLLAIGFFFGQKTIKPKHIDEELK